MIINKWFDQSCLRNRSSIKIITNEVQRPGNDVEILRDVSSEDGLEAPKYSKCFALFITPIFLCMKYDLDKKPSKCFLELSMKSIRIGVAESLNFYSLKMEL